MSTYGLGTFLILWGYFFIGLENGTNILKPNKFTDKETKGSNLYKITLLIYSGARKYYKKIKKDGG